MQSDEGRFSDLGPRSPFNPISNNYMNVNTLLCKLNSLKYILEN